MSSRKRSRVWLYLCVLLVCAWVVRGARLLEKEFDRLHLSATGGLSREARWAYFLERRLPGSLDEDYFRLLRVTRDHVRDPDTRYTMRASTGLSPLARSIVEEGYTLYWLFPARRTVDSAAADVHLRYRCPAPSDARILETVRGPMPSFVAQGGTP